MARCYTWSEYPFSLDNSMSMRTANVNISPKTPFPELDVELSSHLDPRSGQETPYLEQLLSVADGPARLSRLST